MKYTFEELLKIYADCTDNIDKSCFDCPMYPLINGLDLCNALTDLGEIYKNTFKDEEEQWTL